MRGPIIRLFGKNVSNIHRYWGPDSETETRRWSISEGGRLSMSIFDITLEQWKTRDGFNLPHSFHDATIEEYVGMKGITHLMGLFCLELCPILLVMFGKDKLGQASRT